MVVVSLVSILSVVPSLPVRNLYRFSLPLRYLHPFPGNNYNFASSASSAKFLDSQNETSSKFSFEVPEALLPDMRIVKHRNILKRWYTLLAHQFRNHSRLMQLQCLVSGRNELKINLKLKFFKIFRKALSQSLVQSDFTPFLTNY